MVDVNNLSNPKAGKIELKDVPLVAYDNNGEVVDVEIVPSTVDATLTVTSPSKKLILMLFLRVNLPLVKL